MVRSLFHVWSIMNTLRSITKDLLERNRSFNSVCAIAWPKDLFYLVWYLLSINLFTGLITDSHEQNVSFLIWNLHFKLLNSPMCKLGPVSRKVEIEFIYWLIKALNINYWVFFCSFIIVSNVPERDWFLWLKRIVFCITSLFW